MRAASRPRSCRQRELASVSTDHFLIWEPRDIVGGDFFWFQPINDGYAIIVGDCTGHGVPGAFMTLITWGMLDRMLARAQRSESGADRPASWRAKPSRPGSGSGETNDGLEAGVCFINPSKQELTFAGAHFSLWKAGQKDVMEIKGDRKGLGYRRYPQDDLSDFTLALNAPRTRSISPPTVLSTRSAVRVAAPSASGASRACSSATGGRRCRSRPRP